MYRATGSLAFVAAARSYLLVARDPEDESRRFLFQVKSNLGRECQGIAYTVTEAENGAAILVWDPEPVTITADEALSPKGRDGNPSKRDEAADWLQQVLSDGPIERREIEPLAKSAGFSVSTLHRARRHLGFESQRQGFGPGAKYVWELPCMPENVMRASRPRVACMGTHGDRSQPELALGINGSHGGWAVACRRSLVKALKFLRSALKST